MQLPLGVLFLLPKADEIGLVYKPGIMLLLKLFAPVPHLY